MSITSEFLFFDSDRKQLADLDIRLRNESAPKQEAMIPEYDPAEGVYRFSQLAEGRHLLSVKGDGIITEERVVTIKASRKRHDLMLGRHGQDYLQQGNQRLYFKNNRNKFAAMIAADPETMKSERVRPLLAKLAGMAEKPEQQTETAEGLLARNQFVILKESDTELIRGLKKELLEAGVHLSFGLPFELPDGSVGAFNGQVHLRVDESLSGEDVEKLAQSNGFQVLNRNLYDEQSYNLLYHQKGEDQALLDACNALSAEKGVKMVSPDITATKAHDAAVYPQDVISFAQWHWYTMHVQEAWGVLQAFNPAKQYGSADVIVATHDSGIQTAGGVANPTTPAPQHQDFQGLVAGGNLTALIGNSNKTYFTFDYTQNLGAPKNMQPNCDVAIDPHGTEVSGLALARSDNATGVVGVAPNVRLMAMLYTSAPSTPTKTADGHAFLYTSGLYPGWTNDAVNYAGETFPAPFGTQPNIGPGADIINLSFVYSPTPLTNADGTAIDIVTTLGRNRRGVIIVKSSGNTDKNYRNVSQVGADTHFIVVSGSTLNNYGEETRAPYTCFSTLLDLPVDVCAPVDSTGPDTFNVPPLRYAVVTSTFVAGGDFNGVAIPPAVAIVGVPAANQLRIPVANFAAFAVGDNIIVRKAAAPFTGELHTVTPIAPDILQVNNTLANTFVAGDIVTRLSNSDYTQVFSGTSAAAPMISGISALIQSANPALTWMEVRDILRRTATPVGLRYLGFNRRNKWMELNAAETASAGDVLTANNVVDVQGPHLFVNFPALPAGTTEINIGNTAGYSRKSVILIGAESLLVGAPAANALTITVTDATGFINGDVITIGSLAETYITDQTAHGALAGNSATAGSRYIFVQDVSGFKDGEQITIAPGLASQEIMTIRTTGGGGGFPGNYYAGGGGESFTIFFTAPLANTHPVGTRVIVRKRENVTIAAPPVGNVININGGGGIGGGLLHSHSANTPVTRQNTELRVVLEVLDSQRLRIDPLRFPLLGNTKTQRGRKADFNHGMGFGRADAEEAVKAAINFSHDERDVMIRNFMDDDGVTNRNTQPVHSPDLWITNNAVSPALTYASKGPHENPRSDISAPVFVGSGLNDLSVSGTYTSASPKTYIIEAVNPGATDQFTWRTEGGAPSPPANMTAAPIAIASGLSIRFNATTGHTGGDKWYIRCEKLTNRHVHIRLRNRGTKQLFARSTAANALPMYYYRMMLCLTDGSPVFRYYPPSAGGGSDDLSVTGAYTGAAKVNITIRITSLAPDMFQWAIGNAAFAGPLATAAPQLLAGTGLTVQFTNAAPHAVGDTWVLKCYPPAQKFINIDHYIESNPAVPFSLSSGRPGTWLIARKELARLTAGEDKVYHENWPETNRPARNGFGVANPATPLRMFLLGEVTPHDGKLMGDTAELDNNFSYREIIFARFGFKKNSLVEEVATYIEVDSFGTVASQGFSVQVISDVSTFRAESVKLEFIAELDNGTTETKIFEHNGAAWTFAGGAPAWCTMGGDPRLADNVTVAAGEQYYILFNGTLNASRQYKNIKITPKIYSSVNTTVVLAEESRTVAVYEQSQLASGRYTGVSPADIAPHSHFFTDHSLVAVQTDTIAYGPLVTAALADKQNKFRVTGLFKALGAVNPNAYAVVDGIMMVQRVYDPANLPNFLPNVVNIVLKPYKQAMLGFTPVKYFVYRNVVLSDILKPADDTKVQDQALSSPYIQALWLIHTAQNGAVPFESKVLGFDLINQPDGDKIDRLFNRQDADKQLPYIPMGTAFGKFYGNGGADDFGIEIILEEGEFQPDFAYVRNYKETIVSVDGLPAGTDQEKFTVRLIREKILNYIDPAAFFGMHNAKNGWLQVDDGAGTKSKLTDTGIYDNVLLKFHTRNTLYLDLRNENGLSLNFYGKYDDGSGNALDVGNTSAALTAQPYATELWPLIIRTSVSAAVATAYNLVYYKLQVDYNHKPILYIESGQPASASTKGRFIAGTDLLAAAATKTKAQGFRYPNKDLGGGNKIGTAFLLKMHYSMELAAANSPFPAEVVPTVNYTDNLFGPVDIDPLWSVGGPVIAWMAAQDKKFVDGRNGTTNLGFEHIADRGVAFTSWTGVTSTNGAVVFYAAAKDSFFNTNKKFVPHNGLTGGISKRGNFFEEAMLFDGYTIGFDVIVDGTEVLTMQLQENPPDPRPAEAMLMVGITRDELENKLRPLAGFDNRYPRNLLLQEIAGSPFTDVNGEQYRKYRLGLSGMKDDGKAFSAFPAADIVVYTVDQRFFFTNDFTQAQPAPLGYIRNFEEGLGQLLLPGIPYPISAAAGNTVTVPGRDLRREMRPGDKVVIKATGYIVNVVTYGGVDTVVTLASSPGALVPGTDDIRRQIKTTEDYLIDRDYEAPMGGIDNLRLLADDFTTAVNAIPDDTAAPAAIEALVNNYAPKILQRARLLANAAGFSNADDRMLYWTRIQMEAKLKNHPFLRKKLVDRNRIVKLFESKSRGLGTVSFAAAGTRKKVLLIGFDPQQAELNSLRSNPSGAAALALHGQNYTDGATVNIHVQAVVFPLRYEDYTQNSAPGLGTGIAEDVLERLINPGHPGYTAADKPDMIVVLNQGKFFAFSVQRFASRKRGGSDDNKHARSATFPATVTGDPYYSSTLPELKIIPAAGTAGVFNVNYNNSFEYNWRNAGVMTQAAYLPAAITGGTLKIEDVAHPDHAALIGMVPSDLSGTTNPLFTDIIPISGSGGDFIPNEVFYRLARLRDMYAPALPAGYYEVARIQHDAGALSQASTVNPAVRSTDDFNADLTRQLIEEVRNSMLRAFA